jgi:hypothetical protein
VAPVVSPEVNQPGREDDHISLFAVAWLFTLKMEAKRFSKMSANFCQTTWRHNIRFCFKIMMEAKSLSTQTASLS